MSSKLLFEIRVPIGTVIVGGDVFKRNSEQPTYITVEVEDYTLNAALDRLARAVTKLCEETS